MAYLERISLLVLTILISISVQAQEHISYVTADSVTIHGDWYSPDSHSEGVMILLHMNRSNRTLWKPFAEQAVETGFSALAIDFRGHGESIHSAAGDIPFESLTNDDYARMVNDVEGAVKWIQARPKLKKPSIAIIGASIGANVALSYAAKHPSVSAIALLSPGEDYRGVKTLPALTEYADRPCLIIASEDDNYSMVSSKKLAESVGAGTKFHLYKSGGHGTHLFESQSDLSERLIQYIHSNFTKKKQ